MKIINSENFNKIPDAIFLDIDNTIYDYELAHNFALAAVKKAQVQ